MKLTSSIAAAALLLLPSSIVAQSLPDKAASYSAWIDAENAKFAQCRSYDNKVIKPDLPDTAAQKAGAGTKLLILPVSIDQDYVTRDPEAGATLIGAGAFTTDRFSNNERASMAAEIGHFASAPETASGLKVPLTLTERVTGTRVGRNILGTAIKITDKERHTRGLALTSKRLFSFAKDEAATVMGFESKAQVPPASLKGALVVEPVEPRVFQHTLPGPAATPRTPIQYTDRATIIVAKPVCALILSATNKVLATADAGGS